MRRLWPILCIASLSCYQPDLVDGKFLCSTEADCPEGFVCDGNKRCSRVPGGGQDGGGGGQDGGGGDQGGMACARLGQMIAPGVYACKGNFDGGDYRDLCTSSYHVCRADTDRARLAQVTTCQGGFFAIQLDGSWHSGNEVRCPGEGFNPRVIAGCGTENGVMTIGRACMALDGLAGIRSAIVCGNDGDLWRCIGGLGDARYDSPGMGGVLCCPNG